ncbi:MAG: Asp-tRNA(Asn)/Glu-tRNA(Gln) amidotransferase GatCAB subunit B, partial [Bacilli bacterium]|nr:Asp-tRNA(Asn)/Glu-tRNA(Gln) amidotransferase GatCAB subunit B [Bacilli bacterium]
LNKTEKSLEDTKLTREKLSDLVEKLSKKEITNKVFKDILTELMETDLTVQEIISSKGIETISDESSLREIVSRVIESNQESVQDYKSGKERAIKYLMGQIMKETKGSANPSLVNQLLVDELSKR